MQTVLPSEFKRGLVLLLEGAPHVIEDFHTSGTAQTKHKLHARLRNLKNGRLSDRTFADNERLPLADLAHRRVQFSYHSGSDCIFSDVESFEELSMSEEQIGERRWFIKENVEYRALILDGQLLDLVLPPQITLVIAETAPPVRGGSDAAWKTARLDTGLDIM